MLASVDMCLHPWKLVEELGKAVHSLLGPVFDLVIETLANGVPQNEQMRGIRNWATELKLSLDVDEVYFFPWPILITD